MNFRHVVPKFPKKKDSAIANEILKLVVDLGNIDF